MPEPSVLQGAIIAYRLYDIAHAANLARAQELWAAQSGGASSRGRFASRPVKAVAFDVPPVVLPLGHLDIDLSGGTVSASATARLYEFGVVSLALRVAAADLSWPAFCDLANRFDRRLGPDGELQVWDTLLERLRHVLAPALTRPSDAVRQEDYLVGLVQGFSEPLTAAELTNRIDLAPLLAGETRPLSATARADLLRRQFSYYADDMAVITWDRAFIHEPRGDSDVLDIIEVANAQLLEMRYYDELLDAELPRMYEAVGAARRIPILFSARRFAILARRFHALVAEVTELTEKVDNALQVTEDVYLARIYAAALDLFRVRTVNHAVNRKLSIIRETYTALYDEASASRAALLEVLIVALIALEIVLAFFR
jgi:hypothetical protein